MPRTRIKHHECSDKCLAKALERALAQPASVKDDGDAWTDEQLDELANEE